MNKIKSSSSGITLFTLLVSLLIHQSIVYADQGHTYSELYNKFKSSPMISGDLREILPDNFIGSTSGYSSRITIKDGFVWLSVKFGILSEDETNVSLYRKIEYELKDKYPSYVTEALTEIIVSDSTRVMLYQDMPYGRSIEYYSSYPIK